MRGSQVQKLLGSLQQLATLPQPFAQLLVLFRRLGLRASRPGRGAKKGRPTGAAQVFLCSLYDGTAALRTRAALPGSCRAAVDHASSVETVVVDRFSTRHTAPPRENGVSGRGGREVAVLSRAALPSMVVPRRCRLILQCAALATNAAMSLDSSLRDCGSL